MQEVATARVRITDAFWQPRMATNAGVAIFHQWEQLERVGCIDNFRLVAGWKEGFRQGWFFADSDAYKWLDAACRIYGSQPSGALRQAIDDFASLIAAAQAEDGYLYTYNQLHFPGQRWLNLQIEHELYCHGHLIEAAVSHHEATGRRDLLAVAEKAAGLLLETFLDAGPEGTAGHEEIELALIKLYRASGKEPYLALAEHFLEQRGRFKPFAPLIYAQNRSVNRRSAAVERWRAQYQQEHPAWEPAGRGARNLSRKPSGISWRYFLSALSGNYFQQHRPIREQTVPVGHAVRFAYLETALAMLHREKGDPSLLPALEQAWERMVNRRMYVTGGIGSLPVIEGFGRDYELDPEIAYAETCAALGCLFWNWEMALITRQARYADLFEWQVYNAAAVGMGLDGTSYLYNSPLACRGGITRQGWYDVACCPSNLSRTWAHLGKYVLSYEGSDLWLHQYIGCRTVEDLGLPVHLEVESSLPWRGTVALRLEPESPTPLAIWFRIPSWAADFRLRVNGQETDPERRAGGSIRAEQPASGYAPQRAYYIALRRTWSAGDVVELELPMRVTVRQPHPRVKALKGKMALTRGPLVYCLESVDNPALDLFSMRVDPSTVREVFSRDHFGGVWLLLGRTHDGQEFTAIPYAYWANRGPSQMAVWLRT
jgi:DUF1680 family protein